MNSNRQLVSFREVGPVTVATVEHTNVLDGMNVADFGNQVLEYGKDKPGLHLLVNFVNVNYMSSAGLTELLRIKEALEDTEGSVRVCSVNPDIYKVFQITNLKDLFGIHENEGVDAAVKRFARAIAVAADEDAWASQDAGG